MFDDYKNSIELRTVFFTPTSNLPLERLNQIRQILRDFQPDWEVILVNMYPLELQKLLKEFPHYNFHVENEDYSVSYTILISVSKILN